MATPHYTYCRGNRCLLRSNCKRYLEGRYFYSNAESDKRTWIDNCDEEERDFFDPDKKSE